MRVVAIVQARMSSIRLPGKVMKDIDGKPMLQRVIDRLSKCKELDDIGIATSVFTTDDSIAESFANVFRGSLTDPLERYYKCAQRVKADVVVRVTGDCPCADPNTIDGAVKRFKLLGCDYLTNDTREMYAPSGFDVEVFSYETLKRVHEKAEEKDREHVVAAHIFRQYHLFDVSHYLAPAWCYDSKFSVDTFPELEKVRRIYENLGDDFKMEDIRNMFGIPREALRY